MNPCITCKGLPPDTEFGILRRTKTGFNPECKRCCATRAKVRWHATDIKKRRQWRNGWRIRNPKQRHFSTVKARARERGIEFTITFAELTFPECCPVLGIELSYELAKGGAQDNSASFDRFDSTRGYVTGNVFVISWRANRLKNNGTAAEHRLLADWMDRVSA